MNKTELQKQQTKTIIEFLENKFGVEFTGDDEGGRLGFEVDGLYGEFSRRDLEVVFWDTNSLSGNGWSQDEIDKHNKAAMLENLINRSIRITVLGYSE